MTHWKGKLLADCSRDELLEVINHLSPLWAEHYSDQAVTSRAKHRASGFVAECQRQFGRNVFLEMLLEKK